LQEVGYTALTMDAVAERAGTSRAVLYRRWRNRAELVVAAMRHQSAGLAGPVPDTGSLRGDVLALLRRMARQLEKAGIDTVCGLLGDILSDAEVFDRMQGQVLTVGAGVMASLLERANERGENVRQVSPRVVALPTDLFRHELLTHRAAPSARGLVEIVDDVWLPLVTGPAD
jgi:AcrR family transcriptional regulator